MMCVECGTEAVGLVDGSCPTCYVAKHPLVRVPDVVVLETCAHCGSKKTGSQWQDVPADLPDEWLREDTVREHMRALAALQDVRIELQETPQDAKHFGYAALVRGRLEGVEVEEPRQVLLRVRRGVCDRCSRRTGGFWAALIQLRATDRDVRPDELERAHKLVATTIGQALAGGNRLAFLQREQPEHGGWDYYLGDIDTARQASRMLAQGLGGRTQETAKLVGRREGEDVHRVTFLVRIDLYAPGDFAEAADGTLLRVVGLGKGRLQGVRLSDHRPLKVPEQGAKRLGGNELVEEAVLVSESPTEVQLLDPVTLRTQDVPRPEGYRAQQSPRVIRHDGRLWLVPTQSSNSS